MGEPPVIGDIVKVEDSNVQDQHVCRCSDPGCGRSMGHYDHPACCCLNSGWHRSIPDDDQRTRSASHALCRLHPNIQLNRLVALSDIQLRGPTGHHEVWSCCTLQTSRVHSKMPIP